MPLAIGRRKNDKSGNQPSLYANFGNVYGDINQERNMLQKKHVYMAVLPFLYLTPLLLHADEQTDYVLPTIHIDFTGKSNSDTQRTNSQKPLIEINLTPQLNDQSINQTITQNSWVYSSNTGSSPSPTYYIKGQRATVLVNGMPINQFNSQPQNIFLANANSNEKITVSPNASSVLYGSMGLGGIINIEQLFIDHNQYSIGSSVSYPWGGSINSFINQILDKDRTWALQLATDTSTTDGYRKYSRKANNNAYIALRHQSNTQKLDINFSDTYQYLQYPGPVTLDQDPWEASIGKQKYINHTINSQLSFTQKLNSQWELAIKGQYQQQWANAIFKGYGTSSKQQSSIAYIRPTLIYKNDRFKNTFGSEINHQTFSQSAIINDSNQLNTAIFNQLTISTSRQWNYGIGGRYEHSRTQGQLKKGADYQQQRFDIGAADIYVQYNWNDYINTRASVSRAYQLPFIDNSNCTNPGSSSQFGLQPQTAWIYQIDNSYQGKRLKVKNSTYYMDIRNQFAFASFKLGNTVQSANLNLSPTQTIGNLFNIDYQWYTNIAIGGSFAFNYNTFKSGSMVNPKNKSESVSGNQVPGQPPFTAEAHSKIMLTDSLSLHLQEQYISAMYPDSDFTNSLGKQAGYFLTNIAFNYQKDNWQVSLAIYNLFNKFYYNYITTPGNGSKSYYPANGINGMLSIQYTLT